MTVFTNVLKSVSIRQSKASFPAATRQGFTLIELLVVISIIGILAALLLVNFSSIRERGRDSARKSDLSQIKTALRLYYNDYQTYPASDDGVILGCGPDGDASCDWGDDFTANGNKYMSLPSDPLGTVGHIYEYAQTSSGNGFTISAQLENMSDPQANESQRRCGVAEGFETPGVYMACAE